MSAAVPVRQVMPPVEVNELLQLLRQHRHLERALNMIDFDWPHAKAVTNRVAEYVSLEIKGPSGTPVLLKAISFAVGKYKEVGAAKPDCIRFNAYVASLVECLSLLSSEYMVIAPDQGSWRPQNGEPLTIWLQANPGAKLTKALRRPSADDVGRTREALVRHIKDVIPKRLHGGMDVIGK